jgi:7-keto-8-aminopelargonate synthetase-like enzyme
VSTDWERGSWATWAEAANTTDPRRGPVAVGAAPSTPPAPGDDASRRPAREVVSFASNDYLGLSQHPDVVAAPTTPSTEWGAGAGRPD